MLLIAVVRSNGTNFSERLTNNLREMRFLLPNMSPFAIMNNNEYAMLPAAPATHTLIGSSDRSNGESLS
jgi:hypothetical protein